MPGKFLPGQKENAPGFWLSRDNSYKNKWLTIFVYFGTMAELINLIRSLPRAEKWQLFTILAEELRSEEVGSDSSVPEWQIELAVQARHEVENGKVSPLNQEQFWAAIDAKVEQLESQ